MQIASADQVFIFDLITLNGEAALDSLLGHVFRTPGIVKLGMDAGHDLKRLAGRIAPRPSRSPL